VNGRAGAARAGISAGMMVASRLARRQRGWIPDVEFV